jgi:hypothetical protein
MGAIDNEPVGIPQQRAVSQQRLKTWLPYLQLQHRFNASRLGEHLKLHGPQSCVATHDDSALRAEMSDRS